MTGTADSRSENGLVRGPGGVRIARVCCALVALLVLAAIVYGAVIVLVNYDQIAV
jgi:hypothetical protein